MIKNIYLSILFQFVLLSVVGQDIHFSQFRSTPLLQNPSFAGKSDGNLRAIVNYRSQWGSVSSQAFNTIGANFDMRFRRNSLGHFLAGGVSVYSDVAGSSKMRTTLLNLAVAYHLKINETSYFSGGLQGGFNQKSIDESNLRFGNQFNGKEHNPLLNSNEDLANIAELKPTFSAGISYVWSNSFGPSNSISYMKRKRVNVGFAVHHFNTPSYKFATSEELGLKFITSFKSSFAISSSRWAVQPAAFLALQNKASDVVFGSLVEYVINEGSQITSLKHSASIALGGYYRFKDAIIPTVRIKWNAFTLGFNYDVNVSQLSPSSKGRGGFEFSLTYIPISSKFGLQKRARFL